MVGAKELPGPTPGRAEGDPEPEPKPKRPRKRAGPDPALTAEREPNEDAMLERARPHGSPRAEKRADQKAKGGPVADKGQP
jgi:hypothetical protein